MKPLRSSKHARSHGVVLPIVLSILVILTGLIVAQIRRSTIDERVAANTREGVLMDTAAQTVLRWCEARILNAPRETATFATVASGTPTWQTAGNWTDARALDFTGTTMPGIANAGNDSPRCIIEDATCELAPPISPTGQAADGCNGIDSRWAKFRVTARVITDQSVPGLRRAQFAQSEIRVYMD